MKLIVFAEMTVSMTFLVHKQFHPTNIRTVVHSKFWKRNYIFLDLKIGFS